MNNSISRRKFSKKLLGTVLSFALLDSIFAADAFDKKIQPIADHWAKQLQEICLDLRLEKISQPLWQEKTEQLFDKIQLEDLLQFIDFERLTYHFKFPDLGVNTKMVKFPPLDGLPKKTAFVKKIFGLKKGRAIIPHGHSNMASAHLILQGEFALKHYDKVEEEKNHLIIQPTIDKVAKVGDASSISDEKNNIHWFIANSNTAFTFDVILLDLNEKPYDIHNIDIRDAEKISNGLLRAKKLDVETALKKYGKVHH